MSEIKFDNKYIITYTNSLFFAGRRLAFRKKLLFDITNTPKYIPKSIDGWWVKRQLLTEKKAKQLCTVNPVNIDVSDLQWYKQIQLDECFNLDD